MAALQRLVTQPQFQNLVHSNVSTIYERLVRDGALLPRSKFTVSDNRAMTFLGWSDLYYLEKAVNSLPLRTVEEMLDSLDHQAERIVTASVTQANTYGQINGMRTAGVKSFSIDGPVDSKTCGVCVDMVGRSFDMAIEIQQMEDTINQGPPYQKPFLKGALSQQDLGDSSDDDLQALGFATPPYHPGCRHRLSVVSFYDNLNDVPYSMG